MRRSDLILAFLISPLVAPLTFRVFTAVADNYPLGTYGPIICSLAIFYAYAAALLLGPPAFFLYRALGWSSIDAFALGGAVIGFSAALWLSAPSAPDYGWLFALAGGLSALTFRLLLADYYPRRGGRLK